MEQHDLEKRDLSCETLYVNAADGRFRVRRIYPGRIKPNISYPTLVFLHEGLGCIELWRDFPETLCLATGCSGVVYDRKGYGESEPFEETWALDYLQQEALLYLPAILKALNACDTILIGHSDGGSIALLAAAIYSHMIKSLHVIMVSHKPLISKFFFDF